MVACAPLLERIFTAAETKLMGRFTRTVGVLEPWAYTRIFSQRPFGVSLAAAGVAASDRSRTAAMASATELFRTRFIVGSSGGRVVPACRPTRIERAGREKVPSGRGSEAGPLLEAPHLKGQAAQADRQGQHVDGQDDPDGGVGA